MKKKLSLLTALLMCSAAFADPTESLPESIGEPDELPSPTELAAPTPGTEPSPEASVEVPESPKPATDASSNASEDRYKQADDAYEEGKCQEALELYEQVLKEPDLPRDDQEFVRFRMAYCHLELENLNEAQAGFIAAIRMDPKNDEARLKLGEVLMQKQNFSVAKKSLASIKSPSFKFDAQILLAQIELQALDPEAAIQILEKVAPTRDRRAVYYYWLGVAHFNFRDWKKADDDFRLSVNSSGPNDWTRKYSIEWAKMIRKETRALSGSLTFGYLFDGNVAQSSTQPVSGGSVTKTPVPDESTYIKDQAYWLAGSVDWLMSHTGRWRTGISIDFSSPFYKTQKSYNNQNISTEFSVLYVLSPKITYSFGFKYLDTRYAWKYSQDYFSFSPKLQYTLGSRISLNADLGYTAAMRTGSSKQISGSGTLKYVLFQNMSLLAGTTFTKASADKATFSTSPLTLLTNSVNSNYTTYGAFGGVSIGLPFEIWATGLIYHYRTSYAAEDPTSVTDPARSDKLTSYSVDLSRELIADRWSLNFAYTMTQNRSTGFQSVPGTSSASNYNYDRQYILVSQTLKF